MTIAVFVGFQLMFLAVGLSATFRKRASTEDYLVAGRSVHPLLMAMASSSTNSSGFMFIGLIGETYRTGLSSMWLMVGWIAGDYVAWRLIHRRFRERSAEVHAHSVPGFLSAGAAGPMLSVRVVASIMILMFLGTYASAQLTAGSKALHVLFGWPEATGALLGAAMIAGYSFAGGIRASIWTNTVQAIVMIGSMFLLLAVGLREIGGAESLWSKLQAIDPQLTNWRPANIKFGFFLFMLSWLTAGAGVIGQPHLMTLAMTISSSEDINRARPWYFSWYVAFSAACILVGLCCRVLLDVPADTPFDDELALPRLSMQILSPAFVGLILAGLFAATISTADTQIICCSAAVSQEMWPPLGRTYYSAKLVTVAVTGIVLLIAIFGSASVFHLVTLSWSALASSLGPLLAIQSFRLPIRAGVANAMMLGGLGASLAWRYGLGYSGSIYEVLPGMAAGFAIYGVARALTPASDPANVERTAHLE